MFRLYIPIVFIVLFLLWIVYHFLIKKDLLSTQKDNLYIGSFFIGVWLLLYYVIL